MTFDQIMDMQYRKLLTARDMIREELEAVAADEDALVIQLSIILLLSQLLTDLDSLEAPTMGWGEAKFAGHCYEVLLESEDPGVTTMLYQEDIEHVLALTGKRRLSDEINREIALRFADAANEMVPDMFIGRQHLEEIL